MDITLKYTKTLDLLRQRGREGFLNYFRGLYPDLDLYSFGSGWEDSPRYILKFRGIKGDLIVSWDNSHIIVRVSYEGEDHYYRKLYRNVDSKRFYVMIDGHLYATSQDGEPESPLKTGVTILVRSSCGRYFAPLV